ncbi:glycosyltransferase family 4 protein [Vibrio sp. Isolate23]|uniref:glycosyltransferase family 4 protein n=1 Tax=Vibrio sp. Isolate23 TaxID=2908533 RepID=UPI001EFEDEB7|nr:glycosyltransferase family 4 protein [Vibrio sp. Isolate23]MCG9683939.1 glycosyltransferase family 4 protein [Vibrio sp. Isolate23]
MKSKIILVGPLPPPNHGQSMSFAMLVDVMSIDYDIKVIDIADRREKIDNGFIGKISRVRSYIFPLLVYLWYIMTNDARVYLTISQSRYGFLRDLIFILGASFFGRKVVVHLKGGNYHNFYEGETRLMQYLISYTLLKTERILVLGKKLVHMYDFEPGLRERIFVVENGLPFESPKENFKSLGEGSIRLLFLSNLIESKGYLDVLEAVKQLVNDGYDIRVDFAGAFLCNADDSSTRSEKESKLQFERFVVDNSLSDIVTYHGTVGGESKLQLLRGANVFILPTNYNNEGQPVSIIEALAFGIPIIATDYRAIPDMLVNGETGFFVKYKSPHSIVDAVKRISEPEVYAKMSQNCLALFDRKFTREAHISRILKHILGE